MKKIIHIDMDCFYAAIEMRERPELQAKPIAVGGSPDQRGVLCTSNYIARRYGVRSAMSSAYAKRLCPDLIILPVNMGKYREVAYAIRDIFYHYTDLVEPLSLDEAYLDVTNCRAHHNSATLIAQTIRQKIYTNFQLTASAGVAPNKFLAKVASDWHKPNGQFVVTPEQVTYFVEQLPVNKLFGVGKVTAAKLADLHIKTCGQLKSLSLDMLTQRFGRFGQRLYELCRGIDERTVEPNRIRKSVSVEHTFPQDLLTQQQCSAKLLKLFNELTQRLEQHEHRYIHKQFVKIKFCDFQVTTAETTVSVMTLDLFATLLQEAYQRQAKSVRLLGIGVGFKENESQIQSELPLDELCR